MFPEDESRSESDTAGSTCPGMDATLAELVYHFVPGSRVRQIYRTEGAQPTGIAEVARVLFLKKKQQQKTNKINYEWFNFVKKLIDRI